ncbi:transcription initiation factor TFIID subunit 12 isoform X2 [Jatropha curcas]|uniref:transcription initiation factor TFIID subunit 12 isoform X2 n=1 Tax=Jatropha curcas TaxID=180498 RepID=UPI0009D67943|nr:transcription initiation factor TFIID subunit 12 isoform X2 [Jatropha curcas]
MDQPTPTPSTTTTATTATASQPTDPPPPQQLPSSALPQPQQPASQQPPSSTTTPAPTTTPITNPNPNPSLRPSTSNSLNQPTTRPQTLHSHRQWHHPHPHSHFSHFSSIAASPSPSLPSSSVSSLSSSASQQQRGGVAIGVPASHPTPSPAPFSSSFGQQFGALTRGTVNVPESVANASNSQGMGMTGSMSSGSQIRPVGIPAHHQQRPVQSSIRPPTSSPNNQSPSAQNLQGHGFMRPSVVTSGSPASTASQNMQSSNQPWLSGSQGKPPLPSPSYRPQISSPSVPQQRSHIPQQHHSLPATSQQQHMSPAQPQQPLPSHQPSEHFGQHLPPSRGPRSITQQLTLQGSANLKPSSLAVVQPNNVQPVAQSRTTNMESEESGNRILSKRSIHELVSQIDPSEKLDPEVEDILADIADEFVESITTFGCSLAKHRKSDTLEAKDILLHLERNWNITLPGFSGDEIKTYRKPLTSDIHKERLGVIKKSILASEIGNVKNSGGQTTGNAKSNLTKTPANAVPTPNLKTREVT